MTPDELQAITGQLPELAGAVLFVIYLVKAFRAWVPRSRAIIHGSRTWALVFVAALAVTWLLNESAAFTRALVVEALALSVAAIGTHNIGTKLEDEREQAVLTGAGLGRSADGDP